jgi:hypothetical protein
MFGRIFAARRSFDGEGNVCPTRPKPQFGERGDTERGGQPPEGMECFPNTYAWLRDYYGCGSDEFAAIAQRCGKSVCPVGQRCNGVHCTPNWSNVQLPHPPAPGARPDYPVPPWWHRP